MIRDGIEGAIVNIGSTSEMTGQPFISPYCASKGALAMLTRNTAFALLKNRIRVNQLNVGWMSSDHERALQLAESGDPDREKKANARLPFGRLVEPAEAARAVTFMVSAEAGLMTGAVINFDQTVWGGGDSSMPVPDRAMTP
jgi:NAD(P)-dependent dehydrogenase (short-subunit alcohol dehydrogenase family)